VLIYANPAKTKKPAKRKRAPKVVTSNPAARKARKKGASPMAKRRRSAAQVAATRRLVAYNKAKRHKNPSSPRKYRAVKRHHNPVVHRKHRVMRHHNPSLIKGGGVFAELLSVEGAMMVGAAIAAPVTVDFIQETVMPTASGWMKLGIKAVILGAGTFAIAKFLKKPKVALAFGVTGTAVLAADCYHFAKGQLAGLNDAHADYLSTRPELMDAVLSGDLSGSGGSAGRGHHAGDEDTPFLSGVNTSLGDYNPGLSDYGAGLAGIGGDPGRVDPVEAWSATF
jgi:hypothetical protein